MNWIFIAMVLLLAHREHSLASPTPLKLPGHTQKLTPFIRHWEAANFDRTQLQDAHRKHIEQKRHRRKRDLNAGEYGPVHTIRLQFFAHDREFRLVLRQDPLSVFTGDVQIENTLGPMDYDISRIYTGSLEDDENSHIHAILTSDNLLDGTIETNSENYYLEPSQSYSSDLPSAGIHSIVYKVSDVIDAQKRAAATVSSIAENCASERLRRSLMHDNLTRRKQSENGHSKDHNSSRTPLHRRQKRWLPDELPASENDNQNPPMPLDLDMPYNDDFGIFTRSSTKNYNDDDERQRKAAVITSRNNGRQEDEDTPTTTVRNRNIIVNSYHPDIENNNNDNYARKTYTKHKNIIVSTYNNKNFNTNNNNNNHRSPTPIERNEDAVISNNNDNNDHNLNFIPNNFFNTNWTTMFVGGNNDRPSHKTHVEIITKNGATKKPNIIVNSYNPDIVLAPNPNNPNFNSVLMTNLLSGRGDGSSESGSSSSSSSVRSLYDRKITCMLYLQADHTFFQKMGSDEASIEAITRHVQRANSIYKNTDFNNDGKPDNITFMIKRIKVHNMQAIKDPAYRFPGNYGVEKFLELFSEEDYDAFCLAYMFTYRDFEMGTLGLAWTGDLKNAGGVCEKNGHYRGSLKSLNTGIVTLLNYGKHVPPAVSHVTLAHEIGHNFGSPHDPEQCTPGGEDGNFIMFARATSGDKKNNNKFSPCSLKSIEPVLNAKARSVKGCFTEPQTSICGNGVVEIGEQCDCGWEEDCKDSCCFPMSRHARAGEKPCTLTPHAMCSPSQGPCCTADCKLKFGDKCRDDNGCRDPSFCDGHMPQCPPSVNKPNKTICNKEFVCYMGDCTGSICLAYGLESCQCIPGPKDDKIKSCELCCKLPGEGNPCRSSFNWNEPPFDVPDMYSKPGTPCNDYNGYCDVFQKCREVDPSGPLATLRKLLLSEESIASFKKWIQQNWYTVALAAVGVFVLLILSTKLLAKRSNQKLKSVTIIHSATTETVRLPDDNNGVIVHTAVRTKVPFKKKVRGERNSGPTKSKSNSNNKTINVSSHVPSRNTQLQSPVSPTGADTASSEVKKPKRSKKNRVAGAANVQLTVKAVNGANVVSNFEKLSNESKKAKKFKKLNNNNKEIIDYSARKTNAKPTLVSGPHTNTFGKVQKWLLESPIVAQPLSHIDHSVKARNKIMSKSQSTPERLSQKSPQKTKSLGNLAPNEKVKLQVVYKPPFKFSLRLSKNSKVKTHVVTASGNAVNKLKRLSRNSGSANNDGKRQSAESGRGAVIEKTKRSALLLRTNNDEDNQVLTLNEPNYETLNTKKKTTPSKVENSFYENMQYTQLSDGTKMNRSSSKVNLDAKFQAQRQPLRTYNRSNSLSTTTNNPFVVAHNRSTAARKLSESNSMNLSRNFGSTQNLINTSQNDLAKSKKRSSLNLKSSNAYISKDPPDVGSTKRSNSNTNLRRENSTTNLPNTSTFETTTTSSKSTRKQALRRCSSGTDQLLPSQTSLPPQQLPINATAPKTSNIQQSPVSSMQRHSRASFSNIPRASLIMGNSCPATNSGLFSRNSPPSSTTERSRSRISGTTPHQRSNSIRQHAHNNHPPPPPPTSETDADMALQRELPSDLEVMVSDVENLVS